MIHQWFKSLAAESRMNLVGISVALKIWNIFMCGTLAQVSEGEQSKKPKYVLCEGIVLVYIWTWKTCFLVTLSFQKCNKCVKTFYMLHISGLNINNFQLWIQALDTLFLA